MCLDRPPLSQDHLSIESTVNALRHHINIFKRYDIKDQHQGNSGGNDVDDWSTEKEEEDLQCRSDSFSLLMELLEKCSLSGKQEIFRLLFDQRYSVPLIYHSENRKGLICLVESLRFIEIKLTDKRLELMDDTSLPRVAFLSRCSENLSQSLHMAKEVFKCNIPSTICKDNLGLMVEIGIGFLSDTRTNSNESRHWLILHVRASHLRLPLLTFIDRFADIIVYEMTIHDKLCNTDEMGLFKEGKPILKWKITNEILTASKKDLTIAGSFHDIAERMELAWEKPDEFHYLP